tara:strand:+ start:812 stop:1396 length:585 start_codon:yes stop_codon:yes gene_type:complete
MDNSYNIVKCTPLTEGHIQLAEVTYTHQMYSGETSPERTSEVYHISNAVAVLPYDPNTRKVLLIEQFRIGAALNQEGRQIEIIAGSIDEGESPEFAARREAKEEANIDVGELIHLTTFYPCSGLSDQIMDVYGVAMDLSEAGGVHGKQDEGEDIRVMVVSVDEAIELIAQGKIKASAAIIALYQLKLGMEDGKD